MKLGLINPRGAFFSNNKKIGTVWNNSEAANSTKRFYTCPNLGLLTIAALSKEVFEDIVYIDENFDTINFDESFDLVALSALTNQVERAYEIADRFREQKVPVIIGGIHVTVFPDEAKRHVDSVMVGEAEGVWSDFLEDFLNKDIKPIYKNENPQGIDLSKTPIPSFDLINIKNHKIVSIQTSRGCPHDCEFCSSSKIFGTKYRFKSVEQVVKEIEALIKVYPKPYIYFADDNMTVHKKYIKELLNALIPLKIRWQGYSDIAIADDEELLKLLRKSGCTNLLFGLESLSQDNLNIIDKWKVKQLEKYEFAIAKIQSYGVGVFGSFILGLDHDTSSVFKAVRDFVINNKLFGAIITVQTPLPGSRLFDRLKNEGRILNTNWSNYTLFDVVSKPLNMDIEELEAGLEWVYKEIYSKEAIHSRSKHFKDIFYKLS